MNGVKSLMRRFVDEFARVTGPWPLSCSAISSEIAWRHPGVPDREAVKAAFALFRRAVPDLRAQVHEMLADRDKVVTRETFHGTHTGEFMGLSSTESAIAVAVMDIVRVGDSGSTLDGSALVAHCFGGRRSPRPPVLRINDYRTN